MANAAAGRSYDPYRYITSAAYDGSAARVLEGEGVLEPRSRTRQRQRRRELTRPKAQVREAGSVSPFAVVGFAALAVLAVLILMSYVQLSAISGEMVSLKGEMTTLQSEEAVLRARYELAYDVGAIEDAVTADGSMGKPQAGQIVYVDLTEPDSVVVYDRGEETSGSFLDSVRSIVENILSYF